jgi:hypothetical protein
MSELIRCTRCILPGTLSAVTFDENGVCNHCRKYDADFKEWDSIKERREQEFKAILLHAKKLKRPYDVLVPLSGGKDSTYALYLCSKVYALKVLAVTLDNGYLTQPARNNISNALKCCSADHIYYTLNRENSDELFSIFTRKTGDFCNACMRSINYSIEFASRIFRIPLIVKGSGRRVQYVSQIKEVSSLNTASYFANVIKGTGAEKKFDYLSANRHKLEFQKIAGGITDIMGIPRTAIMRFIPQHIGMYDYIYRPFPEIVEILKKEMLWSDNKGTMEHLDCDMHDVPFFKDTLRIPGITKYTFYNSGLIRQGLITRQEALEREESELKKKDPPPELLKFLAKGNLGYDDYVKTVINSDKSRYEPVIQKLARDIYHKMRKY